MKWLQWWFVTDVVSSITTIYSRKTEKILTENVLMIFFINDDHSSHVCGLLTIIF